MATRSLANPARRGLRGILGDCLAAGLLVCLAGCAGSSGDPSRLLAAPIHAGPLLGTWTYDVNTARSDDGGLRGSTIRLTEDGFDRVTVMERDARLIEVGESGTWAVQGQTLALSPETVTVIVTQPGDVSAQTFEPDRMPQPPARLSMVGDRLVLEMLESGETVGRIAYRRGR